MHGIARISSALDMAASARTAWPAFSLAPSHRSPVSADSIQQDEATRLHQCSLRVGGVSENGRGDTAPQPVFRRVGSRECRSRGGYGDNQSIGPASLPINWLLRKILDETLSIAHEGRGLKRRLSSR